MGVLQGGMTNPEEVLAAIEAIINLSLPADSKVRMIQHVLREGRKSIPVLRQADLGTHGLGRIGRARPCGTQ